MVTYVLVPRNTHVQVGELDMLIERMDTIAIVPQTLKRKALVTTYLN